MFIPKKTYASAENIADGEYTAKIARIRMTKDNETVMFICSITNEGYDNMEVTGFARANWNKPSGRTTANLLQWCKNLGAEIVDGQEDLFDIETLVGKQCRIITQSYVKKSTGESAVKVSNILPLSKKPIPNPMSVTQTPKPQGIHVGKTEQSEPQQSPVNTTTATPAAAVPTPAFVTEPGTAVEKPVASTTTTSSEDADLW